MSYPWWYIPYLTSPMLIALVAVVHVIVSHYAVGGGILLARENRYALKKNDEAYRRYWKNHAHFFVLLTVVFGAITGVGIWWTIGLASPLATETLIRTFLFGWAIEWVFFVIEIVAAFIFYYYWDRLDSKKHIVIGDIYALAAWISLVLITAITAYMLNSRGLFGDGLAENSFWLSFFNQQFLPQTAARTGGALLLATFYVYLHATWTDTADAVRETVVRRMITPSIVGLILLAVGVAGWFFFLPVSSRMMLERAAAMNIMLVLFAALMAGMTILIVVGPIRAPKKMSFALALALFLFGIAAIACGEFLREAVRKPYIIDRAVYGNQINVGQAEAIARRGYMESGVWTRLWLEDMQKNYPNLHLAAVRSVLADAAKDEPRSTISANDPAIVPTQYRYRQSPRRAPSNASGDAPVQNAPIPETPAPLNQTPAFVPTAVDSTVASPASDTAFTPYSVTVSSTGENAPRSGGDDLLKMSDEDQTAAGRVLFMHHCNNCHAAAHGYSAAGPMLTGKTVGEIVRFVRHLNRPGFYMPPWCGNDVEAALLAKYLETIRPEMPSEPAEQPEPSAEGSAVPTDDTATVNSLE